jgi:hypothetical protein
MPGDVLISTFYFRTELLYEEGGEGQAEFVFELARHPWTKCVQYPVRVGYAWKKITVPFVARRSHAAGEAQMTLRLGFRAQIVEIGGLSMENFQKKLAYTDLPKEKITYPGMDPYASWRKSAEDERSGAAPWQPAGQAGACPAEKPRIAMIWKEIGRNAGNGCG